MVQFLSIHRVNRVLQHSRHHRIRFSQLQYRRAMLAQVRFLDSAIKYLLLQADMLLQVDTLSQADTLAKLDMPPLVEIQLQVDTLHHQWPNHPRTFTTRMTMTTNKKKRGPEFSLTPIYVMCETYAGHNRCTALCRSPVILCLAHWLYARGSSSLMK
jgi:hypothetical protein